MRLTKNQISAITTTAKQHFGLACKVYLFGSRTDDNGRGGDIDLLIKSNDNDLLTLNNKLKFLVDLKLKIGDQKIDVVFDSYKSHNKNFLDSVRGKSVELC